MENILDIIEDRILYVMIKRIEEMIEQTEEAIRAYKKNGCEHFMECEIYKNHLSDLEELKKLAEKNKK